MSQQDLTDASRTRLSSTDLAGDTAPLSIGLRSPHWPPDKLPNGIVTYVADLAEGLRSLGHRVTILTSRSASSDLVYDLGRADVKRWFVPRAAYWLCRRAAIPGMSELSEGRRIAAAVGRAALEREIDVIEMEESFGLADLVRQVVRIPVAVRLHGPWFLNGPALGVPEDAAFQRRVNREGQAIRRAMALTAPSLDVLERTREYYKLALEQAVVIPNPTRPTPPAERWRPGGCDPKSVLFVGRFDRHKGGDLIIEAFGRVLGAIPDARLYFAGPDRGLTDDDGQRWKLEEFVDHRLPGARASGRVHLLGHVPHSNLASLRRASMVTVVCSRYETFGLTVTEAMATGCPIVATKVGAIPEIIRDGVDGLLCRAGDTDDLADKLVALLTDPDRAAGLGRQAVVRCEQEFHPVTVAARMVAYYRRFIKR